MKSFFSKLLLVSFGPLFLLTTNPDTLPLPLLIVPFIWLFATILYFTRLSLRTYTKATNRQAWFVAVLAALVPVLLLVFQSIHQLSMRDVLLTAGIVIVATIYMLRADFIK